MLNQPKDFWNMRARTYDQTSGEQYARTYDDTAARSVPYLRPGDRVLDFACGTGLMAVRLAPHAGHIRGIDIAGDMAAIARGKVQALGLDNVEITNTALSDPCLEPGSFDVVAAFNVLCYLPDLAGALDRLRELLKPGGIFLSATDCLKGRPTRMGIRKFIRSRTGSMPYVAFLSQKELARAVERGGFQLLEQAVLFSPPPNVFLAAKKPT